MTSQQITSIDKYNEQRHKLNKQTVLYIFQVRLTVCRYGNRIIKCQINTACIVFTL